MQMTKQTFLIISLAFILMGCTGIPKGLQPVSDFDSERYLGTWYEIARLDHKFERGMSHVQATYSKREKGGISVVNKGYIKADNEWKSVEGKAYLNGAPNEGRLKVSFFGPFYGGYNIVTLDEDYNYSLVAGPSRDNLWILSRSKEMNDEIYNSLVAQAKTWGFATDELIKVEQGDIPNN